MGPASFFASRATLAAIACLVAVGCGRSGGKLEALRDSLAKDDEAQVRQAVQGLAPCEDATPVAIMPGKPGPRDTGCLGKIATSLGSAQGFLRGNPNQPTLGAVAVLLARDGRGDWVSDADLWLIAAAGADGPGADALRLALARSMAQAAPRVGRPLNDENDARAAMKAISEAIPGACTTYTLLGSGANPAQPEHTPEHSFCVQHDLGRVDAPGPRYGSGVERAVQGALALYREAARSLRSGVMHADPSIRAALTARVDAIAEAVPKTQPPKADAGAVPLPAFVLSHLDAGVGWVDAGDNVVRPAARRR